MMTKALLYGVPIWLLLQGSAVAMLYFKPFGRRVGVPVVRRDTF